MSTPAGTLPDCQPFCAGSVAVQENAWFAPLSIFAMPKPSAVRLDSAHSYPRFHILASVAFVPAASDASTPAPVSFLALAYDAPILPGPRGTARPTAHSFAFISPAASL